MPLIPFTASALLLHESISSLHSAPLRPLNPSTPPHLGPPAGRRLPPLGSVPALPPGRAWRSAGVPRVGGPRVGAARPASGAREGAPRVRRRPAPGCCVPGVGGPRVGALGGAALAAWGRCASVVGARGGAAEWGHIGAYGSAGRLSSKTRQVHY